VLFFGSIGLYLLLPGKRASPPVVAVHTRDVLPGGNKAILVLADKTTISLDSASSGTVATQGQSNVFKSGHSLVYEPTERVAPDTAMLFNTVITPTGGQYHLVLSDGTKVWLDSRSSLQFPPAFGKGSREVKMTGQAYFEVADNPAHPFLVHVGDRTVSVLGTKFNINAFPEEGMVKTTLAEGSVKVQSEGHVLLLHPGQQAMESRQLVEHPDMEETLAWKEGLFRFNNATLPAVTRQLTRWYGVDFIYKDSVRASFVGDVPREVPLSRVLRLLELTKHVRFDINNKTITIMKY
jgi:ferric-dicitrate binding protein FerR (iron transport regulator)